MNWDVIEGRWTQLKGLVKEQWGDLTDNEIDEAQGRREAIIGSLQARYGLARDEIERQVDSWAASLSTTEDLEDRMSMAGRKTEAWAEGKAYEAKKAAESAVETVKDAAYDAKEWAKDKAEAARDSMAEGADAVAEIAEDIKDAAKGAAEDARQVGETIVDKAADAAHDARNWVKRKIA